MEPLHAPFHLKLHTEIQSVQDAKMHGDPNLQLTYSCPRHSRDLIRWSFSLLSNTLQGVSPAQGLVKEILSWASPGLYS